LVPEGPRGRFRTARAVSNGNLSSKKGRLQATREVGDEIPIGVGLGRGTQVVHDVRKTGQPTGGVKGEGEGDRVGSAGAGDKGSALIVGGARPAGERTPTAQDGRYRRVTLGDRDGHREEYRETGGESGGPRTPNRRATYRGVVELERGRPEGLA
jgi:hypothetical protein